MDMSYLSTTRDVYRDAALNPQQGLCCTTTPVWQLPELAIPKNMLAMNYGCGSTVNPRDLVDSPTVLYVGVGGGMEVLQFAYFTRRAGRRDRARRRRRDAGGVPHQPAGGGAAESLVQVLVRRLAQGRRTRLARRRWHAWTWRRRTACSTSSATATSGARCRRCTACSGRTAGSSCPTRCASRPCPRGCENDERLRALCLTGAIPLDEYVTRLTDAGFGTIEVRAKRPYRVLSPRHYPTDRLIVIESVEICAIKDPMPADGPCVFTGRTAIYHGDARLLRRSEGPFPDAQPAARRVRQDRPGAGGAGPRRYPSFGIDLVLRRRRVLLISVRSGCVIACSGVHCRAGPTAQQHP